MAYTVWTAPRTLPSRPMSRRLSSPAIVDPGATTVFLYLGKTLWDPTRRNLPDCKRDPIARAPRQGLPESGNPTAAGVMSHDNRRESVCEGVRFRLQRG